MIFISHTVPGSYGSCGVSMSVFMLIGPPLSLQGVLGLGKKKKSPIGFERVVRTLASKRYRAPDDVGTYHHCVCVMNSYELFTYVTK